MLDNDNPRQPKETPALENHTLAIAGGLLAAAVLYKAPALLAKAESLPEISTALKPQTTAVNCLTSELRGLGLARRELPSFSSVKSTGRPDDIAEVKDHLPRPVNVAADSWLAKLYDSTKPALVRLHTIEGRQLGSGFFVDSKRGLLATNHHVIAGREEQNHLIYLADGKSYQARPVGIDPLADIAVLKVVGKPDQNFPALKLGNPLEIPSKRAAAMGYPMTGETMPVISPGSLSHLAYTGDSRLHFNMKSYFGNSGSPIVGRDGTVLAVLKTGVAAGEYSAPSTIGANVEHLRTLLKAIGNTAKDGPLALDTEILSQGRRIFNAEDIIALRNNPQKAEQLKRELAVRIVGRSTFK